MQKLTRILGTALVFSLASVNAGGTTEPPATYRVSISDENPRVALVTATLIPVDTTFYMFPGATEFPARWATFVSDFGVYDSHGNALPVSDGGDGSWQLPGIPGKSVTMRYQVNLDHEDHAWSGGVDGAAYARDWGVFYTARSLFVANGDDRRNLHVEFQLPDSWIVTTPWEETDGDSTRFVVADHEALATSILFAGRHEQVAIDHGNFSLLLALGGESVISQRQAFVDMAKGVLDYYSDLMGDLPRIGSSNSRTTSVVVISEADMTDGEAIGHHISMLLEPDGGPMPQLISRLLFAHEFFHLWNGKSFTPNGNNAEWFKEGFSNYYTMKALHQIGLLDDQAFLDLLAGFFYQRYDSDPAVGKRSITEGDLKHDHWGLIYSGGLLVAIAQDLQIRTTSGNTRSLDDLMRHMFDQFSHSDYDIADIERELARLNKQSQSDFFERYVYGNERIPIDEYLALAGIETLQRDGQIAFRVDEGNDRETAGIRRGFFGE